MPWRVPLRYNCAPLISQPQIILQRLQQTNREKPFIEHEESTTTTFEDKKNSASVDPLSWFTIGIPMESILIQSSYSSGNNKMERRKKHFSKRPKKMPRKPCVDFSLPPPPPVPSLMATMDLSFLENEDFTFDDPPLE